MIFNFQASSLNNPDAILDNVQEKIDLLADKNSFPVDAVFLSIPIRFEVAKRQFVVILSARKSLLNPSFTLDRESGKAVLIQSLKAQQAVWN